MLSENTHQQEQHQQAPMSNETDSNGKDKMIFDNSKDDILNLPGWQEEDEDDVVVLEDMDDVDGEYDDDCEDDDNDYEEGDAEVVIEHPFEPESRQQGALLDFDAEDSEEKQEGQEGDEMDVEIENISLSNILPAGSRRRN